MPSPPRPDSSVPPPPPYAPTSGGADAALAGMLGAAPGGGGAADPYPATVLMARHCGAVSDYAALLTGSRTYASMVVSAAFARVLDELRQGAGGTEAAVRPRLLVAARRTLAEWAGDTRIAALLTGLPNPAGPAPDRELVARAFAALPGPAQVLLWHREVEAEGISIPAALLAIDPRAATAQLEEARELFRAGCLRAHSELAAAPECRHYNRLLDISLRRGGALIPDIQRHLSKCRHCRYAADQLRHSDGRLPLLLAEGVLGEGARAYVESRPGRSRARTGAQAETRRAGRHSRAVPVGAVRRLARVVPGGGALLAGLGVVLTGVLGVAALSGLWTDTGGGHGAGTAAPSSPAGSAAPAPGSRPTTAPPPSSAGHGGGALTTRLRNAESGLCLDIRDGRPQVGAELTLAPCSGHPTQAWRYERDGLLRSAAAPVLCPNSQESSGVVVLRLCATQATVTVRYDLSIQGHVVPRWHAGLGLVPATAQPGTTVVVKLRDGSASQRWLTDDNAVGAAPSPRRADGESGDGDVETARSGRGPSPDRAPGAPGGGTERGRGAPPGTAPGNGDEGGDGDGYGVRGVKDAAPGPGAAQPAPRPAPEPAPLDGTTLPAGPAPVDGTAPLVAVRLPGATVGVG